MSERDDIITAIHEMMPPASPEHRAAAQARFDRLSLEQLRQAHRQICFVVDRASEILARSALVPSDAFQPCQTSAPKGAEALKSLEAIRQKIRMARLHAI